MTPIEPAWSSTQSIPTWEALLEKARQPVNTETSVRRRKRGNLKVGLAHLQVCGGPGGSHNPYSSRINSPTKTAWTSRQGQQRAGSRQPHRKTQTIVQAVRKKVTQAPRDLGALPLRLGSTNIQVLPWAWLAPFVPGGVAMGPTPAPGATAAAAALAAWRASAK